MNSNRDIESSTTPATPSSRRSRTRTGLVAGLSAGLIGGLAAGLVVGVPGIGSAASEGTAADTAAVVAPADDTAEPTDGDRVAGDAEGRGHRHRRPSLETASEIIGVEVDVIRDALRDGATLSEIAAINGVSEEALVDGLVAAAQERLDQAVADERLDADRAAQISEGLEEKITAFVNGEYRDRHPGRRIALHSTDVVTDLLGIDAQTLRDELIGGSTLVEVAAELGVSEEALVDALVADAQQRLDDAVADGRLDADRAAELSETLTERITQRVNGERPDRPQRPGRAADSDAEPTDDAASTDAEG